MCLLVDVRNMYLIDRHTSALERKHHKLEKVV